MRAGMTDSLPTDHGFGMAEGGIRLINVVSMGREAARDPFARRSTKLCNVWVRFHMENEMRFNITPVVGGEVAISPERGAPHSAI